VEAWLGVLPTLLLAFCRMLSFFAVAPLFSSRLIPAQVKIGIAAALALSALPALRESRVISFDVSYVALVLKEIAVGLTLGFLGLLFFSAVQTAGAFVDIQIGFGIANVIDPMTGLQAPIVGQLKYMVALLLLLSTDAHHWMIAAAIESFRFIPPDADLLGWFSKPSTAEWWVRAFAEMFLLSFQLAAPLVVSMLIVDVALGMLAKTAPQFNIFMIGLQVKILVALALFAVFAASLAGWMEDLFAVMARKMEEWLAMFGPGG